MPFCPNCKYEYEAGVDRCADCGAPLVERLQEEHPQPRPEVPLVKLAEGLRPMVELLADILRKCGIESLVRAAGPAWMYELPALSPQAEILLRSDDLDQNRDLIKQEAERFGDHIIWFPAMRD